MQIYRYLEKKYADLFFTDGSLMISTLERCRTTFEQTDVRGDAGEGMFTSEFSGRNSTGFRQTISQYAPAGTMVLCCSDVHSGELHERFGVDGCIEIADAEEFFEVVSAALPVQFTSKEMGRVRYLNGRVERHVVDDDLLLPPPMAIPLMIEKVQSLIQAGKFSQSAAEGLSRAANGFPDEIMKIVRRDAALCKPASPFKVEGEVRMLWYSSDPAESTYLVKCPAAIKLCKNIQL